MVYSCSAWLPDDFVQMRSLSCLGVTDRMSNNFFCERATREKKHKTRRFQFADNFLRHFETDTKMAQPRFLKVQEWWANCNRLVLCFFSLVARSQKKLFDILSVTPR